MTVSDNTIVAEGLGNSFKSVGKKELGASTNGERCFKKSWKRTGDRW